MIEETEKRLKERGEIAIGAIKKAIDSLCISESDFEDWVSLFTNDIILISYGISFPREAMIIVSELTDKLRNLSESHKLFQTLTHPEKE